MFITAVTITKLFARGGGSVRDSARHQCRSFVQMGTESDERWMLSATPGQPKERKKHHGAIRNMIAA